MSRPNALFDEERELLRRVEDHFSQLATWARDQGARNYAAGVTQDAQDLKQLIARLTDTPH